MLTKWTGLALLALVIASLACGTSVPASPVVIVVTATPVPALPTARPTAVPTTRVMSLEQWANEVLPLIDDFIAMSDEGAAIQDLDDINDMSAKWLPVARRNHNLLIAMTPPTVASAAHAKFGQAFYFTIMALEIGETANTAEEIEASTEYLLMATDAINAATALLP
jgi:hypothetical protein